MDFLEFGSKPLRGIKYNNRHYGGWHEFEKGGILYIHYDLILFVVYVKREERQK